MADHRQHFFEVGPFVGEPGHLGLAAGFTFFLDPFSKRAFGQHGELKPVEGHALEPLGFVVAVEELQVGIQQVGKGVDILRGVVKFDQPVMPAPAMERHVDGCYRIVADGGPECAGGELDSAVSIIDHHLFAKGVDILFGAAGDAEAMRIRRGKHHCVTDLIAPQAAISSDDHGIRLTDLHGFERYGFRRGMMPLAFGDKLIVDAGIRKEQEPFLPVVGILGRKVALGGIVDLLVGKAIVRKHSIELLLVRPEAYAAVHVDGCVGPDLLHIALAGELEHAAEQHQGPGRDTGEYPHIFTAADVGHDLDLLVPLGEQ